MSTRTLVPVIARLAAAALCLAVTVGCGGDLLRTGRAPVYLTISRIQAHNGALDETTDPPLFSDVITLVDRQVNGENVKVPVIFGDTGAATIRVTMKNPSLESSTLNAVTINRYRVTFRRADGHNTPGVDVPYGFDGTTSVTIQEGAEAGVIFDLARVSAKEEPPLRNLVRGGGQVFIYTIAEVTFFGRDQNGNEVVVTGSLSVNFSDYADPE